MSLKSLVNNFRDAISPTEESVDSIDLSLTKAEFMSKMLKEKDGWALLDLLEMGESEVAERLGLIHGYIENSTVYFDIPQWNTLLNHLRIVNSV